MKTQPKVRVINHVGGRARDEDLNVAEEWEAGYRAGLRGDTKQYDPDWGAVEKRRYDAGFATAKKSERGGRDAFPEDYEIYRGKRDGKWYFGSYEFGAEEGPYDTKAQAEAAARQYERQSRAYQKKYQKGEDRARDAAPRVKIINHYAK